MWSAVTSGSRARHPESLRYLSPAFCPSGENASDSSRDVSDRAAAWLMCDIQVQLYLENHQTDDEANVFHFRCSLRKVLSAKHSDFYLKHDSKSFCWSDF